MPNTLKEMDNIELVNLKRLAYILKGLSAVELDTLEILMDEESHKSIIQSLKEFEAGERIPIDE